MGVYLVASEYVEVWILEKLLEHIEEPKFFKNEIVL